MANDGKNKVQLLSEVDNADLNDKRNEYHFRTPILVDSLSHMLKDQRDLPMLCLLLNIFEVVIPGMLVVFGISLYQPQLPFLVRNLAGLCYVVSLLLLFQERFTLCIHFASHRSVFHNEHLNSAIGWVLAPFFGIPCGLYKLHHVIMHHIENNHELDTSSTECYQRDSVSEFLRYWFHFAIGIYVELIAYMIKTKRWSWLQTTMLGLALYWGSIYVLATRVDLLATVWCFIIPHVIAMSAMAFGNWSQHIFVNPEDRMSNYALTYNCIDTPVNKTTFNDGYHIIHHMNARLHWSEMPKYFYDNKDKFEKSGSLTFRGVHFLDVGILVMTGQLRKLAQHYVHLGAKDSAPTIDEVEKKLTAWLRPVPQGAGEQQAKKGK